ncbi:MAG: outer membrane lipoprotein carrier protein LolA [Planctomycetota bacterium]
MKPTPAPPLAGAVLGTAWVVLCAVTLAGCTASAEPTSAEPELPKNEKVEPSPSPVQPVVAERIEPTAEGWLTVLEASASELQTLAARVRMTTIADLLGEETQRFGSLKYAAADDAHDSMRFAVRFDRVKLDHLEDIDQSYVYDGRWLLDLDAKDKTATRRELVREGEQSNFEIGDGPFLLPLNLRKDRVLQKFDVELIDAAEGDPESDAGTFHLRLVPKPAAGTDAQRIDLWFDRDTLLPLRAATLEADDDQTIVDLFRLEPNAAIADGAFDTALPTENGWQLQVVPLD